MAIYFLSIHRHYAEMIFSGTKRWEFRQNSKFGVNLKEGDQMFIVSTSPQGGAVTGICEITKILRGAEIDLWFGDKSSGRWLQAGCAEGTGRDWAFFSDKILGHFSVAVGLRPSSLDPPVSLENIIHSTRSKPWRGIGLTPLEALKRYRVQGEAADRYFLDLARSQFPE